MKPRITQSELARRLGISRSTVAAALNPASPIKLTEETRQRVAKAAEKWNYRADRYARVMRGGKSGLVGLLHFGGLLQVAAERAFHATAALRRAGFEVLSADLSWSTDSIQPTCLSMIDARVEGVVIAGLNDPGALQVLEQFRAAEIPVVALSGNPLSWAPHFRGDACQAYFEMTRHLMGLGHRRLALMLPLSQTAIHPRTYTWAAGDRLRGFEAAIRGAKGRMVSIFERAELSKPSGLIAKVSFFDDPFNPFETGRQGMNDILSLKVPPTVVLCSNDELAYGAIRACREKGVTVPEQMAITGYDDIALGRYCEVPLTTIRQPNQLMAYTAIDTLLDLIRGAKLKKRNPARAFPCQLIIRSSCGATVANRGKKKPLKKGG